MSVNALASDSGLLPGFADPVGDAQKTFRAVLEAMARPGTIVVPPVVAAAPSPLAPVTAAVLLTLADHETPVWLDAAAAQPAVREYLRFHCGAPLVERPDHAVFAVIADPAAMPPLSVFHPGSDDYPDRSATLILQVSELDGGDGWCLRGPGIRDRARLRAGLLPAAFRAWVRDNHALFPRGVDLLFAAPAHLAGLPRSTLLED